MNRDGPGLECAAFMLDISLLNPWFKLAGLKSVQVQVLGCRMAEVRGDDICLDERTSMEEQPIHPVVKVAHVTVDDTKSKLLKSLRSLEPKMPKAHVPKMKSVANKDVRHRWPGTRTEGSGSSSEGEPSDEGAKVRPDDPVDSSESSEHEPAPKQHKTQRKHDDVVVPGLNGREFVSLKVGQLVHAGWSLPCGTCGYAKNLYHVKSGKFDDREAQRRLLEWEKACPGERDDHKLIGGALLSWYAR